MDCIVAFVILHYKNIQVTDKCVRSILQMEEKDKVQIVIVDNDINESEENRWKLVERYKEYSNITVLPVKENGGFSYGNNLGYCFAREKLNASFIVVSNNDIVFLQKEFIHILIKSYERSGYFVIGPDIIHQDTGKHQNPMSEKVRTVKEAEYTLRMNKRGLKYFSLLFPALYLKVRRQEKQNLNCKKEKMEVYASAQKNIVLFGACLIFTPAFVRKEEKAFWPETRFFYEEYILAWRCQKNGYETLYEPSLRVVHESGAATRSSYKNIKRRIRFQMESMAEASEVYLKFIK